jgi:hypothetical protein
MAGLVTGRPGIGYSVRFGDLPLSCVAMSDHQAQLGVLSR